MALPNPLAHQPHITFIVVNWNQPQLTTDCLHSLFEQDYDNFKVILVDNGSVDNSVEMIRPLFPDLLIIANGKNLGIAGANNVGIQYALGTDTHYIFLLNNDTIVDKQMLSLLVAVAASDQSIGMTGPTMLYYDHSDVIWCTGGRINWLTGSTKLVREGQQLNSITGCDCEEVDYIPSCAVCIKRAVIEKIGLVDERTFIYYDEVDLFARAQKAGWRSIYVPEAKMWHKVSATMKESSPLTDYYMVRNNFLFLSKNLSGWRRLRSLALVGLRHLLAILAYTVKSHSGMRTYNRNAKWYGIRDAIMGKWGKIHKDIFIKINQ